ncbi:hypothetical protein GCM10023170_041670 [Phytohabitans houttuyneae]|uniref:Uncharacterized protein n=1 Tax=Phytohabitans houttuyneae TaxID=1076126 RepID=A0A6V8KJM0_9ACTN|nr:hypothetical protein Phou_068280 [Phytohabitans houttuyneae]
MINRCLERYGFEHLLSTTQSGTFQHTYTADGRYGINDLVRAERYGYHPALDGNTPTARPLREAPISTDLEMVMTGGLDSSGRRLASRKLVNGQMPPVGGCVAEAARKLGARDGRTYLDTELAQVLSISSYEQSFADSRVQDAVQKWSSCMLGEGYDIDKDPTVAPDRFPILNNQVPSGVEIRQAVADVTCKIHSNLVGVWFAVETAYQSALIDQNLQELAAAKDSLDTAISRATTLMAGAVS